MRRKIQYAGLLLIVVFAVSRPQTASAAEAKHAWKAQLREAKLVHTKADSTGPGPIPAHFGALSATARLAYLVARRDVDPTRFDAYHPALGLYLAKDERLIAAQSQTCMGMNGLFPNTALTRYLHYRRNLDPTRFDHYHPGLGALLAEDDRLKSIGCVGGEIIPPTTTDPGTPVTTTPGSPSGQTPSGGQGINPDGVPEPASLTLIVLGSAVAGVSRLRRRSKNRKIATS